VVAPQSRSLYFGKMLADLSPKQYRNMFEQFFSKPNRV
jgi:hypothetical protein